jgi:hypothetical protein
MILLIDKLAEQVLPLLLLPPPKQVSESAAPFFIRSKSLVIAFSCHRDEP